MRIWPRFRMLTVRHARTKTPNKTTPSAASANASGEMKIERNYNERIPDNIVEMTLSGSVRWYGTASFVDRVLRTEEVSSRSYDHRGSGMEWFLVGANRTFSLP